MTRSIFTLLAELQSTLIELGEALAPLKNLVGLISPGPAKSARDGGMPFPKVNDGGMPFPAPVRRRGPGKKKAASRKSAPAVAPTDAPTPATEPATRKPGRKKGAKGTKPNPNLALQGKYMSSIRGLSKADKAEVKKVRAEQGVEEAIKLAAAKGAK